MGTGDHLRDVRPGDAFPRDQATVNAWQRAARQNKASERSQSFPPLRFPTGSSAVRQVRNDSGNARDRFDVLGIDGVVFDPTEALDQFKTDPVLKGVTPTDDHEGKFAILLEPLPANAFGPAVLAGVCCVEVNVTDADHDYAEVSDGAHYLASGAAGSAEILWKESGTGLKWAQVRFPSYPSTVIYGSLQQVYDGLGLGSLSRLRWIIAKTSNGVTALQDEDDKYYALQVANAGLYRVTVWAQVRNTDVGYSLARIYMSPQHGEGVGPMRDIRSHVHYSADTSVYSQIAADFLYVLQADDYVSIRLEIGATSGLILAGAFSLTKL